MEIRLATVQDKEKILEYDRHIHRDRLEHCIASGLVYALCDGEKILGVLRYSLFWQSFPFLDLIFIDGAFQNRGWGRKMMTRWEQTMMAMGYSYVMLSTQEDEDAKYFYEKLGYRTIGAFLPPEQDANEIMYLKELSE